MNPTPSDRHISQALTSISLAYSQDQNEYVARRAFLEVPVDKQYDKFYEFNLADWVRIQMKQRAPGTESQEGVYRLSNKTYAADVFALHKNIPDAERANADSIFDLDSEATEWLTGQALAKEESDFVSNYMKTGVWGTDIAGVASGPGAGQVIQWDSANGDPVKDIDAGIQTIKQNTGQRANVLVLSDPVWRKVKNNPNVRALISGGATADQPAIVMKSLLARVLELDEVLVTGAIQNTAKEGQTGSFGFIAPKGALLLHRPRVAGRMTPAAGYTFSWRGYLGNATAISKFRIDTRKSDRIEIEAAYVQQITGQGLGYYWTTIIA